MRPRFGFERQPLPILEAIAQEHGAIDDGDLAARDQHPDDAIPLGTRPEVDEFDRTVRGQYRVRRFRVVAGALPGFLTP